VDIGAVEYVASSVVTATGDSGNGSLRDAATFSTNGTTVTFTNTLSGQTLLLTGGEIVLNGNLTIDGSALTNAIQISGNHSSRIFEVASNANITLTSLTLMNGNSASGGAVLVDGGGSLTMVDSTVSSNSAAYGGGLVNYGTLTISNSAVLGNVATNNSGGVENDGGTLTIAGSLISSNSAFNGGGVGSYFSNAVTVITNTTVSGNWATNVGGAIANSAGGTLQLNNSTLYGNSANNAGGGLENEGSTLTIAASVFSGNSAGNGGSIRNAFGSTLQINNTTLSGNSATNNGGGIVNNSSTLTLNNSTICGNSAGFGGGFLNINNATATMYSSTLYGNAATNNGGGIANNSSALTLNNATLVGNSAGFGGAIYNVNTGTVTLVNATLSANSANSGAGGGGGIFQNNSGGLCALTNTIVAGNTAAGVANNISGSFSGTYNLTSGDPLLAPLGNYGGPTLTMRPQPGSPAIDAGLNSVTNSLATDQRGYPRQYGAHVDIGAVEARLVLVSNLNDSGTGSLRDAFTAAPEWIGFATNLAGGTLTLTNGQINIAGDVTVDASTLPGFLWISGNHSNRIFEVTAGANVTLDALWLLNGYAGSGGSGGAILVDGGGTLALTNCTVSGNSATGIGGGVGNFGGVVGINNSTLSDNAGNFAGAIENEAGTLTINASTLSGNIATNNGGAIDNDYGATLLLNNSTFSGNSAGGGGGALENYQATATLNNCTLSANSAGIVGGGFNNQGTLALTNTIVAGNTAPDLYLDSSGSFTGLNNLTNGIPLLAPLGNYGGLTQTMPPLHGSPAIDHGLDSVTNLFATDQRGYPRRSGSRVDIGAVEAQQASGGPPLLTSPALAPAGTFSFGFTNVPVADFTVLGSTNVALPRGSGAFSGPRCHTRPGGISLPIPPRPITRSASTAWSRRSRRCGTILENPIMKSKSMKTHL
jgi:hypothetical protein